MANRKKPVWLTIVGEVTDAEQHTDRLELVTEGYLYEENGVTCITYDETEVSGMAGTTTTVKMDGDRVSVIRMGEVNSLMEFERDVRMTTMYATPFGEIPMDVTTTNVSLDFNQDMEPAELDLQYAVDLQGKPSSTNNRHITVRGSRVQTKA